MNPPTAPAASFDILLMIFGNAGGEVATDAAPESTPAWAVSFASLLACPETPTRVAAPVESPASDENMLLPQPAVRSKSTDPLRASLGALPVGVNFDNPPPLPGVAAESGYGPIRNAHSTSIARASDPLDSVIQHDELVEFDSVELRVPHQDTPNRDEFTPQSIQSNAVPDEAAHIVAQLPATTREPPPIDQAERPPRERAHHDQIMNAPLRHRLTQAVERLAAHELNHPIIAKLKQVLESRVANLAIAIAENDQPAPTPNAFALEPLITHVAEAPISGHVDSAPTPEAIPANADPRQSPRLESTAVMEELTAITPRHFESASHVVIDLALPELGTVQIEMSSDADETSMRIQADPPLHLLIRENLHEFVAALSESGIELAGFDLRQHADGQQSERSSHVLLESPGGTHERSDATTHFARTGLARYRLMSVTA